MVTADLFLPQPTETMMPPGCPGPKVRRGDSIDYPRELRPEGQHEAITCALRKVGIRDLGGVTVSSLCLGEPPCLEDQGFQDGRSQRNGCGFFRKGQLA